MKNDSLEISVPEWAKKVVWYQIFPERFYDGDPNNAATIECINGAYPHDMDSPWKVHPWTSDWYELQDYEKANGKDIWYNIQRRRYGGDLQGILDKLPYLKELGITGIYLNPIFESPSSHKYDLKSFHHVDPVFGFDPKGDRELIASEETPDNPDCWHWTSADLLFLKLVKEAHLMGIRVILDAVFNHISPSSRFFSDVRSNQEKSRYKDWFKIVSFDDEKEGTSFDYVCWNGLRELAEFRQENDDIATGPKQYIYNATKRWMQPVVDGKSLDGIDGWRLDAAFFVPHKFWKEWRLFAKSLNPEAFLLGELTRPLDEMKPYLKGDEFDAVTNYNFAFAACEYFVNKTNRISTSEFDGHLKDIQKSFPKEITYTNVNLYGSHDTNRLASHIVNPDLGNFRNFDEYYMESKADNVSYNTRKPNKEEYRRMMLFVIFQMTYQGAPMVYYGDEVGMWGANDPCCRKPMLWVEKAYEQELYNADGSEKEMADFVAANTDMHYHYKKLIAIRNGNSALQTGETETIVSDDEKGIYGYVRKFENQQVLVILNNSEKQQSISFPVTNGDHFIDLLNDNVVLHTQEKVLQLELEPYWGRILRRMEI